MKVQIVVLRIIIFTFLILSVNLAAGQTPAESATAAKLPQAASKPVIAKHVENKPILPKYNKLLKINNEVSGWIKIEGTRIDYPILQHKDDDYYLHRDINKKTSRYGCIFMCYCNDKDLLGKNTLIYGHHMKNNTMFADLVLYKDKKFFDKHREIYVDSLHSLGIWEVFSVYIVNANKETIPIFFKNNESFLKAAQSFQKRSKFKTDTLLSKDDRIVTLSTCSYEAPNTRTIVHTKYIGERS